MKLLKKWRADFLFGKALRLFEREKFNYAASIFEELEKIEAEINRAEYRKEFNQYYLGRCYSALGKNYEAINMFSNAYPLLRKRIKSFNSVDDIHIFKILASEYIDLLTKTGQKSLAQKIGIDRDKFLGWNGKRK